MMASWYHDAFKELNDFNFSVRRNESGKKENLQTCVFLKEKHFKAKTISTYKYFCQKNESGKKENLQSCVFLKETHLKRKQKCAFVNIMASVCLRTNKLSDGQMTTTVAFKWKFLGSKLFLLFFLLFVFSACKEAAPASTR